MKQEKYIKIFPCFFPPHTASSSYQFTTYLVFIPNDIRRDHERGVGVEEYEVGVKAGPERAFAVLEAHESRRARRQVVAHCAQLVASGFGLGPE